MLEQITPGVESLANKINYLEKGLSVTSQKIDDTYSLSLLQPLMEGFPFIPFTGAALRPFCLIHIINDIVINSRKNIIEFGSGLSTIMIGRLIKKNNLDASILSIEHSEGWVNLLTEILKKEKLDDIVRVVYAPLIDSELSISGNQWYNTDVIKEWTANRRFDMVIIDGPPAWERGKEKARYPALPFIKDKLANQFSIYLDDANRGGEQSILQQWKKEYAVEFRITGGTLAYYYNRNTFFTEPFSYY